jgi:hypothetical protein
MFSILALDFISFCGLVAEQKIILIAEFKINLFTGPVKPRSHTKVPQLSESIPFTRTEQLRST